MNVIYSTKPVGTTGSDTLDGTADLDCADRRGSFRGFLAVAALGAAVALSGCAADNPLPGASSTKFMKPTRDALFSTFAACLLPGFNDTRSSAYAGQAAECRFR